MYSAARTPGRLFADHAVAVSIVHERIGRMAARHRRDAVASCLLACDTAVAVVVPAPKRIDSGGRRPPRWFRPAGYRFGRATRPGGGGANHLRAIAAGKNACERGGLAAVDGEAVFAFDLDDAGGEPAAVHRRQPAGRVVPAFGPPRANGSPPERRA